MAFGLVALVLSALLSVLAYALVRSSLLEERQTVAERQAYTNARLLRSRIDPLPPDMSQLLGGLQIGPTGTSLLRIGDRWYSSTVQVTSSELPGPLADAADDGRAALQRFELDGVPVLGVGVPIASADAVYFELSSLAEVDSTLSSLARALLIAGLVATALGAALGAALGSVILQPLRRFAEVARSIAGGDSTSRLDAGGDADLEPLAQAFNEMLDELDERIERERRFASDVSHEIRGPVAALASAVSIVDRRRDQLPEEVLPVVDALDEQVSAFNQLVLDLLEISRFDARTARVELAPLDLAELCREVLRSRGGDGVALRVHEGAPTLLDGDRRRLEQVVSNLLENAALYAGGATDLEVVPRPGVIELRVLDRGPGVDPDEREEIFARFRRGRASDRPGAERGTGLGLALSRQHVELHGGTIRVEDRPGGGATFVVELPRST
jgi:signal transduction histidine kinase